MQYHPRVSLLLDLKKTGRTFNKTGRIFKVDDRIIFLTWYFVVHYHFHYWHRKCAQHRIKHHYNRPQYMTLLLRNNLVHLTSFEAANYSISSMITLFRTELIIMSLYYLDRHWNWCRLEGAHFKMPANQSEAWTYFLLILYGNSVCSIIQKYSKVHQKALRKRLLSWIYR